MGIIKNKSNKLKELLEFIILILKFIILILKFIILILKFIFLIKSLF